MSERSMNWLKFGGLVSLAFVLGLLFAGLLDLPHNSLAQDSRGGTPVPAIQTQQTRAVANNPAAYYVNVHTQKFLNGAVRGQLRK